MNTLSQYNPCGKSGVYRCRLDITQWGKSANLLCYFTNIENGEKYRLSVFFNNNYMPRNGTTSFKEAAPNTLYEIEIKEGKNGKLSTFVRAEKISS